MKKHIKQIMFFIYRKNITVYEYNKGNFDIIQNCGEDIIEYSDDFLPWLKNAIAYSSVTDQLDYMIITDNSIELDFSDYNISSYSTWDNAKIEEFNKSKLSDRGLILRNKKNKIVYKNKENENPLEYNVIFSDKVIKSKEKSLDSKENNSENNIEVNLSSYFQKKLEEDKKRIEKIRPEF